MQNGREAYIAPSIEVIKIENEGAVMVASGSTENYTSTPLSSTGRNHSYNSASGSDLEDMINDILTVEN
ncbi:hypothetical protein [Bacteroides helcogenes]|nr:hypothetical protein [Bacteroides helcogenes]